MSSVLGRRDVLLGLAAGLGLTGASLGALLYRILAHRDALRYALGEPGPTVNAEFPPLSSGAPRPTLEQGDGPFYVPRTPLRRDVRPAAHDGAGLVLQGRVLDARGNPVAGAVLDLWQADERGRYDHHGYGFRGHQYTDADGRWEWLSVRPREYTGLGAFRAPHVHAKVQGLGTPMLSTVVYFPDEADANARDDAFREELALTLVGRVGSVHLARFDFVLGEA